MAYILKVGGPGPRLWKNSHMFPFFFLRASQSPRLVLSILIGEEGSFWDTKAPPVEARMSWVNIWVGIKQLQLNSLLTDKRILQNKTNLKCRSLQFIIYIHNTIYILKNCELKIWGEAVCFNYVCLLHKRHMRAGSVWHAFAERREAVCLEDKPPTKESPLMLFWLSTLEGALRPTPFWPRGQIPVGPLLAFPGSTSYHPLCASSIVPKYSFSGI